MSRIQRAATLAVFLVSLSARASSTLIAGEQAQLKTRLEQELLENTFHIKIVLGSSRSFRHSQTGTTVTQAVDTELEPDGPVRYYARVGCCPLTAGSYVGLGAISLALNVGSRVRVTRVSFLNDRIEILLAGVPGGEYAKLKLMLGRGYERRWDADQLLRLVGRALRIERVEQEEKLEAEFRSLQRKIEMAEKAITALVTKPHERLEALGELRASLEEIIKNRLAYQALTGRQVDISGYSSRLSSLEPEIAAAKEAVVKREEEARRERIASLARQLDAVKEEIAAVRRRLSGEPVSLQELEARTEDLKRWRALVEKMRELMLALGSEGWESVGAALAEIPKQLAEVERTEAGLENLRGPLRLAELEREYSQMEKERLRLLDSYTRAFGTPEQERERMRLLEHLQRMHRNRGNAVQLGSKRAAEQILRLSKEIERIKAQR
jgi:hypothetical protein